MKKAFFISFLLAILVFNGYKSISQCNNNILVNASFEEPTQNLIGNNNLGVHLISGWAIIPEQTSPIRGIFNIIKTDGSIYPNGPDISFDGNQYMSIKNCGGIVYQDFSLTATQNVGYKGSFSSKQHNANYIDWIGKIDIVDLSTDQIVSSSNSISFTNSSGFIPEQESWFLAIGNTTLPPGNYRFAVSLGLFGNFDAAFLAPGCILSNNGISLNGKHKNGRVHLNWKNNLPNNGANFEIEKSTDGRNFTKIGVKNFDISNNYIFIDNNPTPESKNYYRIKKVNQTGIVQYSDIIIISTKGNISLLLSPNPTVNNLTVSGLKGKGQLMIKDAIGRSIIQNNILDIQSIIIDVSKLPKGPYTVLYTNETNSVNQKFIKQ